MEIKLNIPKTDQHQIRGGGFVFCRRQFLDVTQVPRDRGECFLIASKDKPDMDAESIYTITQPRRQRSVWATGLLKARVRETNRILFDQTEVTLAKLFGKGYRYLHVEYN